MKRKLKPKMEITAFSESGKFPKKTGFGLTPPDFCRSATRIPQIGRHRSGF